MKMFCEKCEEKLEIKKQVDEVKKQLENIEWCLATQTWEHNVNVNLVRAKEELDKLVTHRAIKS